MYKCTAPGMSVLSVIISNTLYFPTSVVNISLPAWKLLPRPTSPLMRFHVLPDESLENDVTYAIALETTSGLFTIDGDLLKLNEESFLPDEIVSSLETVVVTARTKSGDVGNTTINLLLTGDQMSCEKAKRNLCFWKGASYQLGDRSSKPVRLGSLSSQFYQKQCPSYQVDYSIVKVGTVTCNAYIQWSQKCKSSTLIVVM
ncbi:hypothetical protein RUM43_002089 [Polyplax serrata]|uniref:Uncharacterized protein n=1 Tax=Polyplax serrata TaxID=468196 RepID=A0AAN8PDB7_POLSC